MKTYKLKDLLSIENGKNYKSQGKGNVPVYGSGGIMLYIDNYLYDGESILLPRKGTLDNISYVNGKFWTIDTMYWTKVNKEVAYPKYLYYYLSLLDLSGRDSGSTLPSMTFNAYYTLDIELPELSVQKQIADSISLLDDKIKNNNKINAKLEELTKTIYDYWFLQFDFPNENGKPYKTSGGKMTYSNELKREIPEGWRVESLIKNSISKPVKNGIDKFVGKKNYLATADINNEDITDGDLIDYDGRESRANMQPVEDSIWFAKMKASIKHLTIPESSSDFIDKHILSTGFYGISCDKQALPYLHCFISNPYFETKKDILAHGATQQAVNAADMKEIELVIPNEKTLSAFSNIVYPILESKFNNIIENKKLAELRDFLAPLLMNGQVTIRKD